MTAPPVTFGVCARGVGGMRGSLAELAYNATNGDPLLALNLATTIISRRNPDHVQVMLRRERDRQRRAAA